MRDKANRLVVAFASAALLPNGIPVPAPITGSLGLDLSAYIALPAVAMNVIGLQPHPVTFPNLPYFVQGVSVDAGFTFGQMTSITR